jgi:D-2-hydroxyacid dehydrogenase (NADP+)
VLVFAGKVDAADNKPGQLNSPAEVAAPALDSLFQKYNIKESGQPIRDSANWKKPSSIVVLLPGFVLKAAPNSKEFFKSAAPDALVQFVSNRNELRMAAKDADALVGDCTVLNPNNPRVRWVQNLSVGVEHCLNTSVDWDRVLLTNTAGMSGPYIAEHAITMALMLTHDMAYYHRNQLQGRWVGRAAGARPVNGKTMLVLGLGGIGLKVAEKAAGMGMRVIAMRNSSRNGPDFVDYVGLSSELLEMAEQADFVVNTLPLTSQTTGLFDAAFFATMKTSAYFITVGRGASVVTEDLVEALESGAIAGAGLDVTYPEPLPADHVLWNMPNVLITPHASSASRGGAPDTVAFIRENIRRYASGERMLSVVDPALGY